MQYKYVISTLSQHKRTLRVLYHRVNMKHLLKVLSPLAPPTAPWTSYLQHVYPQKAQTQWSTRLRVPLSSQTPEMQELQLSEEASQYVTKADFDGWEWDEELSCSRIPKIFNCAWPSLFCSNWLVNLFPGCCGSKGKGVRRVIYSFRPLVGLKDSRRLPDDDTWSLIRVPSASLQTKTPKPKDDDATLKLTFVN